MNTTGLPIFDKTFHKTNKWILDVNQTLKLNDRHKAFSSLRAVLHAVRDRMPHEEAVHLGSQLPALLAGYYYQGWTPASNPVKSRTIDAFLRQIEEELENVNIKNVTIEEITEAVFAVLQNNISEGEIDHILAMMPEELEELWTAEITV
mgnify:FL=1